MTKDQATASALKNRARRGYKSEGALALLQAEIARYTRDDNLAVALVHHGFANRYSAPALAAALHSEE